MAALQRPPEKGVRVAHEGNNDIARRAELGSKDDSAGRKGKWGEQSLGV